MVSDRQCHIDEVSGLLIIVVIIMHCFHNADLMHTKIYSIIHPFYFMMPWFFFKSGMFYHHRCNRQVIINGFYQLIIPLLFFSTIGFIIHTFRVIVQGSISWNEYLYSQIHLLLWDVSIKGNDPLWFLFVLFMVKVIYNRIEKYSNFVSIFICVLIFNSLYYSNIDYPFYLASIPAGLLFYMLGNKLHSCQYNRFVVLLSALVYLSCAIFGWVIVDMHWNICSTQNYVLWVPTSLAGIILINFIFKILPFRIGMFEWIGKYSIIFYVAHWLIIEVALLVTRDIFIITNLKQIFAILVLSELLFLPLITKLLTNKKLSWAIGIK